MSLAVVDELPAGHAWTTSNGFAAFEGVQTYSWRRCAEEKFIARGWLAMATRSQFLAPGECAWVLREHLRFGHLAVRNGGRA